MALPSGSDGRNWIVIAGFFGTAQDRWLDDFIDDPSIRFSKIAPPAPVRDWHRGRAKVTPLATWLTHFRHARAALRAGPDGIVTCFPQLAMATAFWKTLSRSKPRIIAYNFNLGELRGGLPQRLARFFAAAVDHFVVHSPEEIARYADYLGLPASRFHFIPLQRGTIEIPRREDTETPFIVAMGSAHRDYPTLISAIDLLQLPTVIVTRESDIASLPQSPHVTFRSKMTEEECLELLSRARICVTPVANLQTASGQVTFVNAMQLGVPTITTRCPGTDGYIEDGKNGILVPPFDVQAMSDAIRRLWSDGHLRETLSRTGIQTARSTFSDEMAATRLLDIVKSCC